MIGRTKVLPAAVSIVAPPVAAAATLLILSASATDAEASILVLVLGLCAAVPVLLRSAVEFDVIHQLAQGVRPSLADGPAFVRLLAGGSLASALAIGWMASVVIGTSPWPAMWCVVTVVPSRTLQGVVGEVFRGFGDPRRASLFSGTADALLSIAVLLACTAILPDTGLLSAYLVAVGCFAPALAVLAFIQLEHRTSPETSPIAPSGPIDEATGEIAISRTALLGRVGELVQQQGPLWILAGRASGDLLVNLGVTLRLMTLLGLPSAVLLRYGARQLASLRSLDDQAGREIVNAIRLTAALVVGSSACALLGWTVVEAMWSVTIGSIALAIAGAGAIGNAFFGPNLYTLAVNGRTDGYARSSCAGAVTAIVVAGAVAGSGSLEVLLLAPAAGLLVANAAAAADLWSGLGLRVDVFARSRTVLAPTVGS